MGSKRVTIMLDEELDRKIRERQSVQIKKENTSVSFSKVLNDALYDSFKRKK